MRGGLFLILMKITNSISVDFLELLCKVFSLKILDNQCDRIFFRRR